MNLVCEKLDITMFNYQSTFVQTYRTQKTVSKGAFGAHRNCDYHAISRHAPSRRSPARIWRTGVQEVGSIIRVCT